MYTGTSEVSQVGTNVGFGMSGTGLTGAVSAAGIKHAGENLVSAVEHSPVTAFSNRIYLSDSNFRLFIHDNLEILSEKCSE